MARPFYPWLHCSTGSTRLIYAGMPPAHCPPRIHGHYVPNPLTSPTNRAPPCRWSWQIEYPEIEEGSKPRHRFMSAYEQRVETADKSFQYLIFAAEPYENISFKIPNAEVDRGEGKMFTHWDPDNKVFSLQFYFARPRGE